MRIRASIPIATIALLLGSGVVWVQAAEWIDFHWDDLVVYDRNKGETNEALLMCLHCSPQMGEQRHVVEYREADKRQGLTRGDQILSWKTFGPYPDPRTDQSYDRARVPFAHELKR